VAHPLGQLPRISSMTEVVLVDSSHGSGGDGNGDGGSLANQARGRWGERRAATHYQRQGYCVLDRNWRCRHGEIDLVLRRDDTIVFCEVKTRRTTRYGGPAEAVDHRKQMRIRRLAAAWLQVHQVRRVEVRFDVVAITGVDVEVIEAAF
jgi:putative endonuclease